MAGNYTHGKNCPITYTPNGGALATIRVTSHTWQEMCDLADVTDTGCSGLQALLAGIVRGDGNIKGNVDLDAFVWSATILVRAGAYGVLRHYVSATQYFAIPVSIASVVSTAPVGDKVEFDFNVKFNSLAGTYSYPA